MHPAVEQVLRHFRYDHLPHTLQGPELVVGLRKLLEAKDCMVRAAIDQQD